MRIPASTSTTPTPPTPSTPTMQDDLFTPPLRTSGRYIVDANNVRLKLASVNWYGGSDELFVPGGLDVRPRAEIAQLIRSLGFNSVRLPYSDELVLTNPLIPASLLAANPDLQGRRALDVYVAVAEACAGAGLAVIANNHITAAGWCDGMNPCDAGWSNAALGPLCRVRQTEEQWIGNWATLMARLRACPRVVGCDLRNEPRGLWGTVTWAAWARAAARAADKLHEINPDWLMFVEGIASANDCSGARANPVALRVPDRVVYSVHVFSWSGWGSMNPYSRRPYPGFVLAMHRKWGYLLEENIAPVWVGEMGGPDTPSEGDMHYWRNLMKYLETMDVDFGYWAINPRKPHENELERWSLVRDDWETVVDDYRMQAMRGLMKPQEKLLRSKDTSESEPPAQNETTQKEEAAQ